MKKLFKVLMVVAFAFVLVACGGGSKEETTEKKPAGSGDKLIVGLEAGFAPYEYIGEGGKVVGIDIDISEKIAEKLGKELEVKEMDFDGALLAVQSGKVDMVASGVSVTEEREKQMDFSDRYVDSTEVVVVKKDNPAVTEPTWDALNGKIVAVQQGNIADIQVSNTEETKPAEIKRYTKFVQATEDLKNGKVDCIVMDQMPAEELVAANSDDLKILEGEPLFVDQYAIAVQKGNKELLDVINEVIKELKSSGELEKIIEAHSAK